MFTFLHCTYDPQTLSFCYDKEEMHFEWAKGSAYILYKDERKSMFTQGFLGAQAFEDGVQKGVRAQYLVDGCYIHTCVSENKTDETVHCTYFTDAHLPQNVERFYFPPKMRYEKATGGTVLPMMQGVFLPAKWWQDVAPVLDGRFYDRDGYMAVYGQFDDTCGYSTIFETPFDAGYDMQHQKNVDTQIAPYFMPSLGTMTTPSSLFYTFIKDCDHNKIAKSYRQYIRQKGLFKTLKEKTVLNPHVERLRGAAIVNDAIATHIEKGTFYFDENHPEKNDYYNTFKDVENNLIALKEKGLEKAYLHLDGWGKRGYDNLHPDVFPPYQKAGGAEGMIALQNTAKRLGYVFGIHDQYRDYYYDADTFDMENAVLNADGTHPYCDIWHGGKHTWLCASLAKDYVKRNYQAFEKLGIEIEGTYLDVFSVVFPDECFHRNHRMTRKECMQYRRECFDYLMDKGIITSSEEASDAILPSICLCHHAPFAKVKNIGDEKEIATGIPVPFFNLVYHECMVVPWHINGFTKGGWGIPGNDSAYLYAFLTGGTCAISPKEDKEHMPKIAKILQNQSNLMDVEMVKHEFLSDNYRQQRATYKDGTVVEIDLDLDTYKIYHI